MAFKKVNEYNETALTTKELNKMDDSAFGLPDERKYPLNDKTHILQAVRFFGYAKPEQRKELATNIIKKAKEYNLDYTKWESLKPYTEFACEEEFDSKSLTIESMIDNEEYENRKDDNEMSTNIKKYPDRFNLDNNDNFNIIEDGDTEFQNEYDEKDVEYLNTLIASESAAVAEYFEGAKNTHDENLRSLYSDIGAEERFHSEQLMYAKSLLTGERYEPRDPDVKKEYQEMISDGMDEETALSTVIDKHRIGSTDNDDTGSLKEDAAVIESAINQTIANMEMLDIMCEFKSPNEELQKNVDTFMESYVYMETVDNVATAPKSSSGSMNPIKLIIKGIKAIFIYAKKLINLIKRFLNKYSTKQRRQREWLKNHSIKELFSKGVSLYFYSDKDFSYVSEAPEQYLDLLNKLTVRIAQEMKVPAPKQLVTKPIDGFKPIPFKSVEQGLDILKSVVLTKSKIVVNDSNEDKIKYAMFSYSKNKVPVGNKSRNLYNILEMLSTAMEVVSNDSEAVFKSISELEGNIHSVYYTNRALYNKAVSYMKQVMGGFNTFLKALASDMNEIIKLNDGILEDTDERDEADMNNRGFNRNNNPNNINNIKF